MNLDVTFGPCALPATADARSSRPEGAVHPAAPATAVSSTALLQGRNVVHIEHNGSLYLLRSTRLGKLILTK